MAPIFFSVMMTVDGYVALQKFHQRNWDDFAVMVAVTALMAVLYLGSLIQESARSH